MQLRYVYRLTPNPGQRRALARAFGCARVVFNDAIATRRAAREAGDPYPTDAALSKGLTAAKRTPQRAWLVEVWAWSTFIAIVETRHGRTFARIDRWFPSTRACSVCGAIGEAKPLHVREWTCPCGAVQDRDVNAARNLLAAGRADSPTLVELVSAGTPIPQPAVKREPAGSTA